MRSFLERISSRKFLLALAVQIAAVVALFCPELNSVASEAAVRVASLATLLLAALGYGKIESAVDAAAKTEQKPFPSADSGGGGGSGRALY